MPDGERKDGEMFGIVVNTSDENYRLRICVGVDVGREVGHTCEFLLR